MMRSLLASLIFYSALRLSTAQTGSFTTWNIPLPLEMDDFGVGIHENTLVVFNGNAKQTSNHKSINNTAAYTLSLSPLSSQWTSHTSINMPFETNNIVYDTQTIVQIDTTVYGINAIMSSPSDNEPPPQYRSLLQYDLASNSYTHTLQSPPGPLEWPCVVTNGVNIYSIGGLSNTPTNEMTIYNIEKNQWEYGANFEQPRYASGCAFDASGHYIFLFAGLTKEHSTNTIDRYNFSEQKWESMGTMNYRIYGINCVLYPKDSKIYCIGGVVENNGHDEVVNYVQIFDPVRHEFSMKHLKKRRTNVGVAIYQNECMMVLGGLSERGEYDYLSSIETMNCDLKPPSIKDLFLCAPNEDCFVDCNAINNTDNYYKNSNFSCNSQQSIINATLAKSVTILCEEGNAACYNLTAYCAPNACDISCDGENGCNLLSVHTEKSSQFSLECSADKTCENIIISNDNSNVLNSVQLNCTNNGCSHVNVQNMGIGELYVNCNDYKKDNLCNGLVLNAPNSNKVAIISSDNQNIIKSSFMNFTNAKNVNIIGGALVNNTINCVNCNTFVYNCSLNNAQCINSFMNFTNAKNVNIIGGALVNNTINCVNCNTFVYNCSINNAQCINSTLNASQSHRFELFCAANTVDYGCHNITAYIPANTAISCDYLGCNALNIYNIHSTVTNDASFTLTNCPCQDDIYTNCINEWNLYCNGKTNNPSIFSNGMCNGECCGNITNEFHESNCSPFDCHSIPKQCNINCTSLAEYSYECDHQIINAQNVTALNVYCTDNINCNDLEINCPFFDAHNITAECNVYCNGTDNCQNMKISTNGINQFNFNCDGICNGIMIDNNYNNNYAQNMVSINCDNAECNNIDMYNMGGSKMSIFCDKNCSFDALQIDGPNMSSLAVYGQNGMVSNAMIHVTNVGNIYFKMKDLINNTLNGNNSPQMSIKILNGTFKNNVFNVNNAKSARLQCELDTCLVTDNIINAMNAINFTVNNTLGTVLNNTFNVHQVRNIFIENRNIFSQNEINAPNAQNIYFKMKDLSNNTLNANNATQMSIGILNGTAQNNTVNLNNAKNVWLRCDVDTCLVTDNIFNAMNAINFTVNNTLGTVMSNAFNVNQVTNIFVENRNIFSQNVISAQNTQNISIKCMDYSVCDMNVMANYSKNIRFSVSPRKTQNSLNGKVNIHAPNAGNIYVEIGNNLVISNDFTLNAANASLVSLMLNGSVMNNKEINTYNTTKYIINSRNGLGNIKNSVIYCDICHDLDIQNVLFVNNTINMNNGTSVNIMSASFANIINGKYLDSFNILCDSKSESLGAMWDLSNAKNISISMRHSNGYGIIMANYSKYINISIADGTLLNNVTLYATNNSKSINIYVNADAKVIDSAFYANYAQYISTQINGLLQNSILNGTNAKYVSILCNTTEKQTKPLLGCQNVSIVTPPLNTSNNKPLSDLLCIGYGCESLSLYTRKDSNDINVTGQDCNCSEDIIDLCVGEWKIYCENEANASVFTGFKKCTGECCAGIDQRLEETSCIKPKHKSDNTISWTVLIILICVGVLAIVCIACIYKRKKTKVPLQNYKNAM